MSDEAVPYDTAPDRLLNEAQREARQAYLAAHPGVDERTVGVTTAGYAPVADWLAGAPGPHECGCAWHRELYAAARPPGAEPPPEAASGNDQPPDAAAGMAVAPEPASP